MVGQLQRAAVASKDNDDEFHAFNQDCVPNQAVLAMRPALDRILGVSSNLVRLGHLFQSHRWAAKWDMAYEALADASAFREVVALPDEAPAWNQNMRSLFSLTRGAKDMTPEDEEFVSMMVNGDPDGDTLVHYHKEGCRCGGRRAFKGQM